MDLFRLHNRAISLLLKFHVPLNATEPDDLEYELYIDEIENFFDLLNCLPEKYWDEFRKAQAMPVTSTKPSDRFREWNDKVFAAREVVVKVSKWLDFLQQNPDSPSFKGKIFSSVLNEQIPQLFKDGEAFDFIVDTTSNFFDSNIRYFPEYMERLKAYKEEILNALNEMDSEQFLAWLPSFSKRAIVFFDNNCLSHEMEWHCAIRSGRQYHTTAKIIDDNSALEGEYKIWIEDNMLQDNRKNIYPLSKKNNERFKRNLEIMLSPSVYLDEDQLKQSLGSEYGKRPAKYMDVHGRRLRAAGFKVEFQRSQDPKTARPAWRIITGTLENVASVSEE